MAEKQEIYEKHSELFHYTGPAGLRGILKSQRLWATHYKFLNDELETVVMMEKLEQCFVPFVQADLVDRFRNGTFKFRRWIRKNGGPLAAARADAGSLAKVIYETAFGNGQDKKPLAIPFITSFCAHTSDDDFTRQHGLVEQWRTYGQGGYAIVFDTAKLCALNVEEGNYYDYGHGHFGDVVYDDDDRTLFWEEFGDRIENVKRGLLLLRSSEGESSTPHMFDDVLTLFCQFKSRKFWQEREVRIVAIPTTPEVEEEYKRTDPSYVSNGKPLKTVRLRSDGVPFIELFDFRSCSLPIKRIIVGPHPNQEALFRDAECLIRQNVIEIVRSEIPKAGFLA